MWNGISVPSRKKRLETLSSTDYAFIPKKGGTAILPVIPERTIELTPTDEIDGDEETPNVFPVPTSVTDEYFVQQNMHMRTRPPHVVRPRTGINSTPLPSANVNTNVIGEHLVNRGTPPVAQTPNGPTRFHIRRQVLTSSEQLHQVNEVSNGIQFNHTFPRRQLPYSPPSVTNLIDHKPTISIVDRVQNPTRSATHVCPFADTPKPLRRSDYQDLSVTREPLDTPVKKREVDPMPVEMHNEQPCSSGSRSVFDLESEPASPDTTDAPETRPQQPSEMLNTPVQSNKVTCSQALDDKDSGVASQGFGIFVKTLSGKTSILDVKSTDTIEIVKEKIQEKEGISRSKQVLIIRNRIMQNERTLAECDIKKDSTVHLLLSLRGGIGIYIRSMSNTTHTIDKLNYNITIRELKTTIYNELYVPVDQQTLVFQDTVLNDEDAKLNTLRIRNKTTIRCYGNINWTSWAGRHRRRRRRSNSASGSRDRQSSSSSSSNSSQRRRTTQARKCKDGSSAKSRRRRRRRSKTPGSKSKKEKGTAKGRRRPLAVPADKEEEEEVLDDEFSTESEPELKDEEMEAMKEAKRKKKKIKPAFVDEEAEVSDEDPIENYESDEDDIDGELLADSGTDDEVILEKTYHRVQKIEDSSDEKEMDPKIALKELSRLIETVGTYRRDDDQDFEKEESSHALFSQDLAVEKRETLDTFRHHSESDLLADFNPDIKSSQAIEAPGETTFSSDSQITPAQREIVKLVDTETPLLLSESKDPSKEYWKLPIVTNRQGRLSGGLSGLTPLLPRLDSNAALEALEEDMQYAQQDTPSAKVSKEIFKLFDERKESPQMDDLMDLCSGKFHSQAPATPADTQCTGFEFETPTNTQTPVSHPSAKVTSRRLQESQETPKRNEKESVIKTRLFMKSDSFHSESEVTTGIILSDDEDQESGIVVKPIVGKKKRRPEFSNDEDNENEAQVSDIEESESEAEEAEASEKEYDSEENEIVVAKPKPVFQGLKSRAGGIWKEFVEIEAELSGSEEGSGDEDERGLDELDIEEADAEEIDQEALLDGLGKQYLKRVLDDDQRDIRYLQEALLEDGDLHGEGTERQRLFKLKNLDSMAFGDNDGMEECERLELEDETERLRQEEKAEKIKWMKENSHPIEDEDEEELDSQKIFLEDSQFLLLDKSTLKKIQSSCSFMQTSNSCSQFARITSTSTTVNLTKASSSASNDVDSQGSVAGGNKARLSLQSFFASPDDPLLKGRESTGTGPVRIRTSSDNGNLSNASSSPSREVEEILRLKNNEGMIRNKLDTGYNSMETEYTVNNLDVEENILHSRDVSLGSPKGFQKLPVKVKSLGGGELGGTQLPLVLMLEQENSIMDMMKTQALEMLELKREVSRLNNAQNVASIHLDESGMSRVMDKYLTQNQSCLQRLEDTMKTTVYTMV